MGITELQKAIHDRDYGRVIETLALTKGHYEKVVAHLDQAIELDPRDHSLPYALGVIHSNGGHPQEAIESFRKALELAPENEYYVNVLVTELEAAGQVRAAIEVLQEHAELVPKRIHPWLRIKQLQEKLQKE
jgi:tetratricopeptide (TPR) repeat protein